MKTTTNYTRVLAIIICIVNSMGLLAQYQLTPECYVDIEPNRYVIHFTLPNYWFEDDDGNDYEEGNGEIEGEDDDCGIFSEIVMEDDVDYDVTDVAGYPELPFFSLNLLLPDCASGVNVYIEAAAIEQDYPPYYILPAQLGSWVNENGETIIELDEGCFNTEYYYGGQTESYPNGFYRDFYSVSQIYHNFDAAGITLSIMPFSYYPHFGHIDVLREAIIVVEFDCGDVLSTIDEIQASHDVNSLTKRLYFDTFNGMLGYSYLPDYNGSYLIVASHRNMEESLNPYIDYKRNQNYYTEAIYLDEYGAIGSPELIEQLIYWNDVLPNPDFVLLVGNLSDIPPCSGTTDADNPYTDDYYHPFIGRWIIGEQWDELGEYAELRNIIDKTIQNEIDYSSLNHLSKASLFSGIDDKKRVSKQFYRNIKQICKSFDKIGIPCTPYNGRNFSQSQAYQYMTDEIKNNTRFFIYRGHGTAYLNQNYDITASGISRPYDISSTQINYLCNGSPTPMGFGFACVLNTYATEYSFGARWVTSKSGGGVTYYGATTNSYRLSNNYLAKWIFKELKDLTKKVENFPISLWLRLGEYKYYWALPTSMRGIQISKYTLIGDPTFSVYGMDYWGNYAPFHSPQYEYFTEDNEFTDSNIKNVEIYDISGKLITISDNPQLINKLSLHSGVYIIKTNYNNGSIEINKFLK